MGKSKRIGKEYEYTCKPTCKGCPYSRKGGKLCIALYEK